VAYETVPLPLIFADPDLQVILRAVFFCCWQTHAIHVVISRKRWHVINDPNGCTVKMLQLLAVFLLHATDGDKIMTWQTAFCRNTAW